MNDLLRRAIAAHGGLERWSHVHKITVAASITGATWGAKGQPDYLKEVIIHAETAKQRVVTDFPHQDKRFVFDANRVAMERTDGTLIAVRDDPQASFAGQRQDTPWDDLQVAYFEGEAMWSYLSNPFLYARPRFVTKEIAPIRIDGEECRRLEVTFPDEIKSHTRTQISCFGPDGLLRRHDYTVDILGGAPGVNYASQYENVDGIVFPTHRRVYAYRGDYVPIPEPLLVEIEMTDLSVA